MFFKNSKILKDQFVQDTLRDNHAKFHSNWSSSFRRTTDNGHKVMTIAHMTFKPGEQIKFDPSPLQMAAPLPEYILYSKIDVFYLPAPVTYSKIDV